MRRRWVGGTSPEPTGAVAVALRADLEEERGRGRRCASLGSLPPHWARRVIKAGGGQRSGSGGRGGSGDVFALDDRPYV